MRLIDTTAEAAEEVLVALAERVPAGVELGRPLVATGDGDGPPDVLTTVGLWQLEPNGAASRYVERPGGHQEVTCYRGGAVVGHTVGEGA